MFRLLKLMAFALFGYAVYEFFRGMSETGGGVGRAARSMGAAASEAFGEAPERGQITGEGRGREEQTLNPDGGSVRHRVGRGVVSGM